ncbi:MAG: peptide ABC transporter permease, partial [Thermodesulfobacteriota bacterium]|nr:peptide ABC transporter permease [Thermodesulfobacteriota bacterium]
MFPQSYRTKIFWERFLTNRLAVLGSVIIITLFIVSIFASSLSPYDPNHIDVNHILESPSSSRILGTDDLG